MIFQRSGLLFILSSPSGAGKTTLAHALCTRIPNITLSVSATTRQPRPGERDGVDYHFFSQEKFRQWQMEDRFLEWANVFGDFYGTLRQPIEISHTTGVDVLFDIDWQGHTRLKHMLPAHVVSVFVLPPSTDALRTRLQMRGDTPQIVEQRMQKATSEIARAVEYDYIIINDQFEDAFIRLTHIFEAERFRRSRLLDLERTLASF